MSSNTSMHDSRESYSGVVPAKQPNNTSSLVAEDVEGRPLTKENAEQSNPRRAQDRKSGPSGLERVREAARQDRKLQFNNLLHHVTVDLLEQSYFSLKKKLYVESSSEPFIAEAASMPGATNSANISSG